MKYILMNESSRNLTEELVDSLVENMRYSDRSVDYPDLSECIEGEVPAELFYSAYSGLGDDSERSAIHQYVTMQSIYDSLGTDLLGIAITEMKHMDILGDLIVKLGGTLVHRWDNSRIRYGETPEDALKLAIAGEKSAIRLYTDIISKLSFYDNHTSEICIQLMNKLIADENSHLKLLEGLLSRSI